MPVFRLALAIFAIVTAGCTTSVSSPHAQPGATIDGIQLGARITCACTDVDAAAVRKLDTTRSGHADVAGVVHFADPLPSGAERSGTSTVVVFNLSDGTLAAFLVYCGVGGCAAG